MPDKFHVHLAINQMLSVIGVSGSIQPPDRISNPLSLLTINIPSLIYTIIGIDNFVHR